MYELRIIAGIYRDHYVVERFALEFEDLEQAKEAHDLLLTAIMDENFEVLQTWFREYFDECLAGREHPFRFEYLGIWQYVEKCVVPGGSVLIPPG